MPTMLIRIVGTTILKFEILCILKLVNKSLLDTDYDILCFLEKNGSRLKCIDKNVNFKQAMTISKRSFLLKWRQEYSSKFEWNKLSFSSSVNEWSEKSSQRRQQSDASKHLMS